RQRAGLAFEREVTEAHVAGGADPISEFTNNHLDAIVYASGSIEDLKPFGKIAHRHPSHVGDGFTFNPDVEGLALELGAVADRARNEAAIFCKQDAHVSFVTAPFEPFEKPTDPRPVIRVPSVVRPRVSVQEPGALFIAHLPKRDGGANFSSPRKLEHPIVHLAVRGSSPGRDQPLPQRQLGVGNDLFQIEFDGPPKSFTFWARADRAVGG